MPFWIKDNGQVIETNDRPETISHCKSIGWELTDVTQEGPIIVNADKGSGIPGTEEWHASAILGMSQKNEIVDYLKELDLKIDQRGSLGKVQAKAITALRGQNDNSKSDNKRGG